MPGVAEGEREREEEIGKLSTSFLLTLPSFRAVSTSLIASAEKRIRMMRGRRKKRRRKGM